MGRELVTETQQGGGPTVLRMLLARQLQALREKAGMTYEQAAEAIYSSPWTVRRMERAEGGLKPLTVKSLLQTEGYIRAITAASFPAATEEFTERAVALRLARQHLLSRPEPPGYWVVLDETVLRRPIG